MEDEILQDELLGTEQSMAQQGPEEEVANEEIPFDSEEISPDNAAATLAFFTNLSEKIHGADQEEPIEEAQEVVDPTADVPAEESQELDIEEEPEEKVDIQEEVRKAVKEEMSGLREDLKKLLTDE